MKILFYYLQLCLLFSMGIYLGYAFDNALNKQTDPKLNLPEEFMCAVSDEPNKPDTVLIYQSVSNDSLYIKYLSK